VAPQTATQGLNSGAGPETLLLYPTTCASTTIIHVVPYPFARV
jgi:hypothetical protein